MVVLEKDPVVGRTTAMSGGVLWIPNNPVMRAAGASDSRGDALEYLEAAVGDEGPATSTARKEAYIDAGSRLVSFLQSLGITFTYLDGYPDYYPELPGCSVRGRSIQADIFDRRRLGAWDKRLRVNEGLKMQLLMRNLREALHVPYALTTAKGFRVAGAVMARTTVGKLTGARKVSLGNAFSSHLLFQALRLGVTFRLNTQVIDLLAGDGRVNGVVVSCEGNTEHLHAKSGVLLAAGGFARSESIRKKWGPQPSSSQWTLVNPDDDGDGISIGLEHGAAVALMDEAIWNPVTLPPEGKPHAIFWERCAPHSLLVNAAGKRFCNESSSYMAVGQAMYANDATTGWFIFDTRHRRRYPFGDALPGISPKRWLTDVYLKKQPSVRELERECGLPDGALVDTVEKFNRMCVAGVDTDFGRGASAYDRMEGDASNRPNPNLGTVAAPPFYAVKAYPGDVSTCGGLVTDEHARVLREDGSTIEGLYAAGSSAATVMGRYYPGAGASLGPATVFGFLAANHVATVSSDQMQNMCHRICARADASTSTIITSGSECENMIFSGSRRPRRGNPIRFVSRTDRGESSPPA